jgi:hypothetical protein
MGFASNAAQPLPVAESLLKAGQNDADWLLPAKTYARASTIAGSQ